MIRCTVPRSLGVLPIFSSQRPHGVPITMIQIKQTLLLRGLRCAHSLMKLWQKALLYLASYPLLLHGDAWVSKWANNWIACEETHKTIKVNKTLPLKGTFVHQIDYLRKTSRSWEQNPFSSLFLLLLHRFSFWDLVSPPKISFWTF